jgi:hypothetical protein
MFHEKINILFLTLNKAFKKKENTKNEKNEKKQRMKIFKKTQMKVLKNFCIQSVKPTIKKIYNQC